jgi:glycosyltransferase involved in cell wall biosynthesis
MPLRYLAAEFLMSFWLRGSDAFWGPGFTLPLFLWSKPAIVTIHDLTPLTNYASPGLPPSRALQFFAWRARQAARRAGAVVTDSGAVKNRLVSEWGLQPERVFFGYQQPDLERYSAIDSVRLEAALAGLGLKPGGYYLSVGTLVARKNYERLARAFALCADHQLVVVGGRAPGCESIAAALTQRGNIRWLSEVDDVTLPFLYRGARALLFPSLDEGYGIPLVEAFASGCPVLCSDIPVFREVAGAAADYFQPLSPESIADCVVAADATRLQELSLRGRERLEWIRQFPIVEAVASALERAGMPASK